MESTILYSRCDGCKKDMPEHVLYGWLFANGEGHLTICSSCKEHIKTIILGLHLSEQEKALYLNNQNKA